jgi:hypothetical protein
VYSAHQSPPPSIDDPAGSEWLAHMDD